MDTQEKDGLRYGTYEWDTFSYTYALLEDDVNYWDVNLACNQEDVAELQEDIIDILAGIELK